MKPLHLVGLMLLVFLVSLPASFLMHAGPSLWPFSAESDEPEQSQQDNDDPVVDVLCLQAVTEMGRGNTNKAIATYTKAIERNPKYALAFIGRGDAYLVDGKVERAIQDYTQATRLDPNDATARERLDIARKTKATE